MIELQDHARAQRAYDHVLRVPSEQRAKYRSMVMKLPALIQTAGLAPALHFVAARSDSGQRLVLDHLASQLSVGDGDALLAELRGSDFTRIRARTREVQRVLVWYKRFCQALLRGEDVGEDV